MLIRLAEGPAMALYPDSETVVLSEALRQGLQIESESCTTTELVEAVVAEEAQARAQADLNRVIEGHPPAALRWLRRADARGPRRLELFPIALPEPPMGVVSAVLYVGRAANDRPAEHTAPFARPPRDMHENIGNFALRLHPNTREVQSASGALLRVLGHPEDDFLRDSKLLAALVTKEFHGVFAQAIDDAARGVARSIEIKVVRRDRDPAVLAMMVYPARNRRGKIIAIEVQGQDITAQRAAEAEAQESWARLREAYDRLQHQHEELQSLDRMKSRLLANVSHELRTPMVTIRGYQDLILQEELGPITPEQREGLSVAGRSMHRLLGTIENLILFTRLERDPAAESRRDIDLVRLVQETARQALTTLDERGITLTVETPDEPLRVPGHHAGLERLLANLLDNAEKFNKKGTAIRVEVGVGPDGGAILVVTDDGVGIAPEHHERVFERFFQVDDSATRKHDGLGIGLALVREIAEWHEGSVTIDSHPGRGTRIEVRLPGPPPLVATREPAEATTSLADDPDAFDDASTAMIEEPSATTLPQRPAAREEDAQIDPAAAFGDDETTSVMSPEAAAAAAEVEAEAAGTGSETAADAGAPPPAPDPEQAFDDETTSLIGSDPADQRPSAMPPPEGADDFGEDTTTSQRRAAATRQANGKDAVADPPDAFGDDKTTSLLAKPDDPAEFSDEPTAQRRADIAPPALPKPPPADDEPNPGYGGT